MRVEVLARVAIAGIHRWPNPPHEYAYLGHPHRHTFHITLATVFHDPAVRHDDRLVEFNHVAGAVTAWLGDTFPWDDTSNAFDFDTLSCEGLAIRIMEWARSTDGWLRAFAWVAVQEDAEGSVVVYA